MRRQQRVGAAQDERVDRGRQLSRTLRAASCLQVGRAGLAAGEDGQLVPEPKRSGKQASASSCSDALLAKLRVGAEETLQSL